MISLYCKVCKKHWYTANTNDLQHCQTCGERLIQDEKKIINTIKGVDHNYPKDKRLDKGSKH